MVRLKLMLLGAAMFVLVHVTLVETWSMWTGGAGFAPWFLNTGRAAAFATAVFFVLNVCVAAARGDRDLPSAIGRAAAIAVGAALAMAVTLFTIRGGPGNLFPIAIVVGACVLASGSLAGACAGWFAASRGRRSQLLKP